MEKLPTVADCRIEVRQSMGMGPGALTVVDWGHMKMMVDCENPLCKGGGVAIGRILEATVARGETPFEEKALCLGAEPMGRRTTRPCTNFYTIKGVISYKPAAS
jgi:hypothetical protein